MKIRNSDANNENAELNMTSMIDIVFQLLVFFIMTFKITAMEGDFNIKMPRASDTESMSKEFDEPIRVELKANEDGTIADIIVNGQSKGTSYTALSSHMVELAGGYGPSRNEDVAETEIEFDCDPKLHYREVISGITAVSGKRQADGEIVKLYERIKFKDNTGS